MSDAGVLGARAMALTLGRQARSSPTVWDDDQAPIPAPLRRTPPITARAAAKRPADTVSLRWETVRLYGDGDPDELEAGVRRALRTMGGRWQVSIGRANGWSLRLAREGAGVVRTTIPSPVGSASGVESVLVELLRALES